MARIFGAYQVELANKVYKGRAIGNEYVVTQRPIGRTTIIARFDTMEKAEEWARQRNQQSINGE